MNIVTQEKDYCEIEVSYDGDEKDYIEAEKKALLELNRYQVPGFRKGKASNEAIKVYFKTQLANFIANDLQVKAFEDVLFETKIKPIGRPKFSSYSLNGKKLSCVFSFLKKPDIVLGQYVNFEIPKPDGLQSPEELAQNIIQELRMRHGNVVPYTENDFVQVGDKLTIDYTVKSRSDEILNKVEGTIYEVGGPGTMSEINDNILGMKAGETREFKVSNPNIGNGETVVISVTVHMGSKTSPCAIDDDLAKAAGAENLDDLNEKVNAIAKNKVDGIKNALIAQQVSKRLVASHDFKVPEYLITIEVQSILSKTNQKSEELTEEQSASVIKEATDNIKLALILDTIRDVEPESTPASQELNNIVAQNLRRFGVDINNFFSNRENEGTLAVMLAELKNDYTLQWIAKNSKIIE